MYVMAVGAAEPCVYKSPLRIVVGHAGIDPVKIDFSKNKVANVVDPRATQITPKVFRLFFVALEGRSTQHRHRPIQRADAGESSWTPINVFAVMRMVGVYARIRPNEPPKRFQSCFYLAPRRTRVTHIMERYLESSFLQFEHKSQVRGILKARSSEPGHLSAGQRPY